MAEEGSNPTGKIVVTRDGPYEVQGEITLVRKTQVVSEYGEPLTWIKEEEIHTHGVYCLCRCGQSKDKPFCDGSHSEMGFDATEIADPGPTAARQMTYPGGIHLVVRRDFSICTDSGFCGTRFKDMEQLVLDTADTQVRGLVMAMVERCPSGSLTYTLEEGMADIEPDLPWQIAVTTEITSDGPIAGPLWVSGGIPVERCDGKPLETRNRVTLCGCGESHGMPLCDGTHHSLPPQ